MMKRARILLLTCALTGAAAAAASCNTVPGADVVLQVRAGLVGVDSSAAASGSAGTTGRTIALTVTTSPATSGLTIAASGVPASIVVSPSTVTTASDGTAVVYALVPYGVKGSVVTSAPGSQSGSTSVGAPPLTLSVTENDAGITPGATGISYDLDVEVAGAPAGFTLSLSALPSSIVVTPPTVSLNDGGTGSAVAFVPYGVSGEVIATAPSAAPSTPLSLSSQVVQLDVTQVAVTSAPTGTLYSLQVSGGKSAEGFAVTMGALPSTIVVSPAAATLGKQGLADVTALVPFGVGGTVVASATGALPDSFDIGVPSGVTLDVHAGTPSPAATGQVFPIVVRASPSAAGLAVTLVGDPASLVVEPTTLALGSQGSANASVFVPYGVTGFVTASAPGVSPKSKPLQASTPTLKLTLGAPASASYGATGVIWPLQLAATNAGAGLPVSLSAAPNTIVATPSSVVTDSSGAASSLVFAPYGVGGTVLATAAGATTVPVSIPASDLVVTCLAWTRQGPTLYEVTATVAVGTQVVAGVPVSFTYFPTTGSGSGTGAALPATSTNGDGAASSFVNVSAGDGGAAPSIAAIVASSGPLVVTLGTAQTGEIGVGPNGQCTAVE